MRLSGSVVAHSCLGQHGGDPDSGPTGGSGLNTPTTLKDRSTGERVPPSPSRMPARTKSRPRRRGPALSRNLSHVGASFPSRAALLISSQAPFSNNPANAAGIYCSRQKELGTVLPPLHAT